MLIQNVYPWAGNLVNILRKGHRGEWRGILISPSILLFLTGCALPVPLSYIEYARTTYDAVQFLQDRPTTIDSLMSDTLEMECRVSNVLDEDEVCLEFSPLKKFKIYIAQNTEKLGADDDVW